MDLAEVPAAGLATRHPWEEARLAFFLGVLRDHGLAVAGSRVLDVGAGDAWFAGRLAGASSARVVCWDAAYAERPPPAPAAALSFTASEPEGSFELVLALDVLEHVEDDRGFLDGLARRRLAAGGHLLLSVPAWPVLFSGHDARLRHFRRYRPRDARALLAGAGLEIVRAGGLFHSLLVPRAAQVAWERAGGAAAAPAGEWRGSRAVTRALAAALAADGWASRALARIGWDVPGLSWWALCHRP